MRTETIYKQANEIRNHLTDEQKAYIDKITSKAETYDKYTPSLETAVAMLLKTLQDEMRQESAKNSGKANIFKLAKDITTAGVKGGREPLGNAFTYPESGDNHQYFCDGYRLLRLEKHIEYPYYEAPNKIHFEKVWTEHLLTKAEQLELPETTALETWIKIQKARGENPAYYNFGKDLPFVNASYLLGVLKAIKNPKAFASGKRYGWKDELLSIIVENEDETEQCLILGERKPKKDFNDVKTEL